MNRFLPLVALLLAGCANGPTSGEDLARTLTPETVSVGLTAPNLISGPTSTAPGGPLHRDAQASRLGTIGVTLSATYRLKPIRIERQEVQPVRVIEAVPVSPIQPNGKEQN